MTGSHTRFSESWITVGISERKARLFRQREQEILRAATDLVERGDWRAVTIDEIARQAEIGKGTVYHHFKSKEEILARLAVRQYKRLLGKVGASGGEGDVPARLRVLVGEAWRFRRERADWMGLIQYCQQPGVFDALGQPIHEEFRAVLAALAAVIEALIRTGQQQGRFERAPLSFMVRGAWGAILGTSWPFAEADSPQGEQAFPDYLTAFILKGWRRDPEPNPSHSSR